jgi:hypothetical protein
MNVTIEITITITISASIEVVRCEGRRSKGRSNQGLGDEQTSRTGGTKRSSKTSER